MRLKLVFILVCNTRGRPNVGHSPVASLQKIILKKRFYVEYMRSAVPPQPNLELTLTSTLSSQP